jgi:site-specific DNA-methyltransferase (adenine-specific)
MSQALLFERPVEPPRFRLYREDAVEWLSRQPRGSADLCITDPAYESLEKHRAVGTTTRLRESEASSNSWFPVVPNAYFAEFIIQLYRVMRMNSHTYVVLDWETKYVVKPLAERAGFRFANELVWDKLLMGMGYHYRHRVEYILFLEKGDRAVKDLGVDNVLAFPRVRGPAAYPTEKPVEMLEVLVKQSSVPGERVIDPFMGSGSTGAAAARHGCHFLGTDIHPPAYTRATETLLREGAGLWD